MSAYTPGPVQSITEVLRIEPALYGGGGVGAGETLIFRLPHGTLDLSMLKMWFKATIKDSNGQLVSASLPRDVETLIDTLEVSIGDVTVQCIHNYGQIFRTVTDYGSSADERDAAGLLGNALLLGNWLLGDVSVDNDPCCVARWLGFLGCKQAINTRLLGSDLITIKITLAPNNVLLSTSEAAAYRLTDIHVTVPSLELVDMEQQVSTSTSNLLFDDFVSLLQSNQSFRQQTQLTLTRRHVDYVLGTFLAPNFRSSPVSRQAYNGTSFFFKHKAAPNLLWNFLVDSRRLLKGESTADYALECLNDVFGRRGTLARGFELTKLGTLFQMTLVDFKATMWACGALYRGPIDNGTVTFDTTASMLANADDDVNMSLLVVKSTSMLRLDGNKYAVIQ